MLSAFDKALAGFAVAFLVTLNQKYGFHFDVGPDAQSFLTSFIDAALNGAVGFISVYYSSNKGTTQ